MISAVVQSQKNAPAAASIQIPANDYAMDLKPRTLVHVFFKDLYNGAPPEEQVSVGGAGIRVQDRDAGVDPDLGGLFPPSRFESTLEQDEEDLLNEQYKVLFIGEIHGIQFSKTPASRSVILQCLDLSSYWDIAYQYQISGYSLGRGGIRAAFTGASTTVFNDFFDGSGDTIVNNLLDRSPRSFPKLKGTLLGALVHIIEAIGGVYYGRRAMRGVNDFFSLAEMRLHLTQMVGANPFPQNDEVRLLRARGFGSLFRRSLSGLGKLVSIRQVLLALQKYIFHEHIPITSPRFIPSLSDPNLPQVEELSLEQDPATRPLHRIARTLKNRAEELIQRQQNATDEQSIRSQSNQRGGLRRELRTLARQSARAARLARRVSTQEFTTAFSSQFSLQGVRRSFSATSEQYARVLSVASGFRGGRGQVRLPLAGTPEAASIETTLASIANSMQQVLSSRHVKRVQRRSQQPDPPPRLLSVLYRPDVWMVAPPRSNVVFPELYSQFTYNRNFDKEITRLLLRTHSAFYGSDVLFDGFFMSPSRLLGQRRNARVGRGRVGQHPDYADAPAYVVKDLMSHELYTGIIPTFERMSDLNLHALRGRYARTQGGGRIPYAQLAANHIFFQYRFKSRQLVMSGKFNPYLAFGFPVTIIDKYLPHDQLRDGTADAAVAARLAQAVAEGEGAVGGLPEEEARQVAEANMARVTEAFNTITEARPNTHYLGTPESMSHSLSANQGGTTNITMGYARTTNEKTEFLGDNVVSRRARRRRNRRIPQEVASFADRPPTVGARGPRGGEIVEVTDITDRYVRRHARLRTTDRTATGQVRYRGGTRLPLYTQQRSFIIAGRRRGTQVLVGVEQPAASYGPEVVALVGTAGNIQSATADANETLVTFNAYRIVEEVGVYQRTTIDVPPEELVFPPWYGDHYKSHRIGGLYSYFFGTGAVTDPLSVIATGREAQRVGQSFDGSTMSGETPASERSVRVEFAERFGAGLGTDQPVSDGNQRPVPGFSEQDDSIGPPGDPDPVAPDGTTLSQLDGNGPISVAIEEVVRAYSQVKLNNFDTHQFIRSYTWRPIATMVDLFGTSNLEINEDGEVVRGREGFHSRAFGDFDDLRQLVGPGDNGRPQTILGLTVEDGDETSDDDRAARDREVAARLDTRKEKRLKVLSYLQALMASRGILG